MIPHTPIPICMYHKVDSPAYSRSWVTPKTFRLQMESFRKRGYQAISFEDFLASRQGGELPEKPFIITFDDGYQSVYTNAYPILKEFDFTATLFLATSYISELTRRNNSWDVASEAQWEVFHLLWSEVFELVDNGFEVGSHTVSHRSLQLLPRDLARNEIINSKAFLERKLGIPIKVLSYPYGGYDQVVKDMVRDVGYKMAVASSGNPTEYLDGDLFALKRKTMHERVTEENFEGYVENP